MTVISAVYPRWRGEHPAELEYRLTDDGLSPLARGTRLPINCLTLRCWFIPAGAGNTSLSLRSGFFAAVYPRWRGEHS